MKREGIQKQRLLPTATPPLFPLHHTQETYILKKYRPASGLTEIHQQAFISEKGPVTSILEITINQARHPPCGECLNKALTFPSGLTQCEIALDPTGIYTHHAKEDPFTGPTQPRTPRAGQ
ncbi:MAG: hypothetical protein EZS28_006850 [Streblomastix strix]|uniref:Uncharacterized protein n=1 Tax=Streblomastix strix TaxID=222440 RepID=A0A5J4WS46_9EUKA|nr:MAG: hypothetical protein EZS28_006850 [Streblomastix strix]